MPATGVMLHVCVPVIVELDDGFMFDYRLTQPPRVTNDFIETSHKVHTTSHTLSF